MDFIVLIFPNTHRMCITASFRFDESTGLRIYPGTGIGIDLMCGGLALLIKISGVFLKRFEFPDMGMTKNYYLAFLVLHQVFRSAFQVPRIVYYST